MSTLLASPQIGNSFDSPVLVWDCDEPKGTVQRVVRPMRLSRDNLARFYDRAKKHRVLFVDDVQGDFKRFCELFMSQEVDGTLRAHGLFWVVDDFVGVFYMTQIKEHEALVHFTFLDGRLKGRVELTREMVKFVFMKYGFRRLNVEVGAYASAKIVPFVQAVGFKSEGRKRKAVLYRDEWYDIKYFGILREEALDVNADA